ncbi:hypothetical protein HBI56_154990 [Parastagonospora nodorum]|uniref:Uncharacterized protein n=1 Tax=Phaeosphaeria nodorum (strain SN15 / ATCC MYA-4574 / FGSC 10173) TaxID=321614 RepID=A0A7U2FH74_PHANO|nr:hypothetical protein HBH56_117670 [Parastagonospora nodorum]QRD05217.1 hypothetical protein JI435_422150 [Parastagonospora nodorum SN15]KAH3928918.1 hypothetical protein HBH54_131540 [Parastagonospora nodorum]KAH3950539.1 hypothetical protein HBH53_071810 [Parastagonospora nodorum]KAH3959894.1 hypothetical protein HBH51_196100 [Parastagonospora nodorum]
MASNCITRSTRQLIAHIYIRDTAQKFRGRCEALVVPHTHNRKGLHNFGSKIRTLGLSDSSSRRLPPGGAIPRITERFMVCEDQNEAFLETLCMYMFVHVSA